MYGQLSRTIWGFVKRSRLDEANMRKLCITLDSKCNIIHDDATDPINVDYSFTADMSDEEKGQTQRSLSTVSVSIKT